MENGDVKRKSTGIDTSNSPFSHLLVYWEKRKKPSGTMQHFEEVGTKIQPASGSMLDERQLRVSLISSYLKYYRTLYLL